MMDGVMLRVQDQTHALQGANRRGRRRMVRPLVELIGGENPQRDRIHKGDDKQRKPAARVQADLTSQEKNGQRHQAVVAVSFDEVVTRDINLIDVVLSKWLDKIPAEQQSLRTAPRVGQPVNEPGKKIAGDETSDQRKEDNPDLARGVLRDPQRQVAA